MNSVANPARPVTWPRLLPESDAIIQLTAVPLCAMQYDLDGSMTEPVVGLSDGLRLYRIFSGREPVEHAFLSPRSDSMRRLCQTFAISDIEKHFDYRKVWTPTQRPSSARTAVVVFSATPVTALMAPFDARYRQTCNTYLSKPFAFAERTEGRHDHHRSRWPLFAVRTQRPTRETCRIAFPGAQSPAGGGRDRRRHRS